MDRDIPVELLIRYSQLNWAPKGKPSVLFSAQMFGSGKSFFAENATTILREDYEEYKIHRSKNEQAAALLNQASKLRENGGTDQAVQLESEAIKLVHGKISFALLHQDVPLAPEDDMCNLSSLRSSSLNEETLCNFTKARTVVLDLRFLPTGRTDKAETFLVTIKKEIFRIATSKDFEGDPFLLEQTSEKFFDVCSSFFLSF